MKQEQAAMIVDVREPEEYVDWHVSGSINLPLSQLEQGTLPDFDKTRPLELYCKAGLRAQKAKAILEAAGFQSVTNLGGLAEVRSLDQGGKIS